MIPNTIEPLITQAVVDKTIIPEIYLRMSCAVAYHNSGLKEMAINHLDKAIKLALADNLYGILTEYIRHFDGLLQERIALIDESANIIISDLYSKYRIGWAKISGTVRNKYIATNLTPREHEIAKLSVFGFNVKEISNMLFISESTVKQTISRVIAKTGIEEKSQFVYII
jgi:DNA-binding NarL/FixJ family response regulator